MDSFIQEAREALLDRYESLENKADILKAPEFRELYTRIKEVPAGERRSYGQAVNELKTEFEQKVQAHEDAVQAAEVEPLDVTAPFDTNVTAVQRPGFLPAETGTMHPLMSELDRVIDIFTRMGFEAVESRQLDNDWNMFGALNFPEGHPARDGYDTFRTEEGLIPPAHTSTMENRILKAGKEKLEAGGQIASISYGRVFRNEDVDATHEHTFYQVEGVFVSQDATVAQMLGTLRSFFEVYYGQSLRIKTQPAYFPFVEPGLEFAIEKPDSMLRLSGLGRLSPSQESNEQRTEAYERYGEGAAQATDAVTAQESRQSAGSAGASGETVHKPEWLEMLGCGMLHPNVLKAAGIDPAVYRGFAWGGGLERLVMLAHGIEDLRHFESAKLSFLRKF